MTRKHFFFNFFISLSLSQLWLSLKSLIRLVLAFLYGSTFAKFMEVLKAFHEKWSNNKKKDSNAKSCLCFCVWAVMCNVSVLVRTKYTRYFFNILKVSVALFCFPFNSYFLFSKPVLISKAKNVCDV